MRRIQSKWSFDDILTDDEFLTTPPLTLSLCLSEPALNQCDLILEI